MRIKLDENLPEEVSQFLRQDGHDVATVLDERLGGATDAAVAAAALGEGRMLVTLDRDFADIRSFRPSEFPGLVVLRLRRQDPVRLISVLQQLVESLPSGGIAGELWIVEESGIRRRSE